MIESPTGDSNVLNKIAIDLAKKSDMQDDVRERLELQREVRPLTSLVNGKSVAQLRTEK